MPDAPASKRATCKWAYWLPNQNDAWCQNPLAQRGGQIVYGKHCDRCPCWQQKEKTDDAN